LTLGYFYNDKKHGYGINYFLNKTDFILGSWTENSLEGISIFSSNEGEQIWSMKKNKVFKKIIEDVEVEAIKKQMNTIICLTFIQES
jgi:hypothetical protein